VSIETARPGQFLSGPAIGAYLTAVRLGAGRCDGVLVRVSAHGARLWMVSTTARSVGGSSCGTFNTSASTLVGRRQHRRSPVPDQTSPAARACAPVGMQFS
jgi:hypothetical protein